MQKEKKLGLFLLTGLAIGSMIGAGIFNSPTDLIGSANPQATVIAWLLGGFGVLMIALVFQMLANKKPELTGGIYSYAREGFGDLVGFSSAWGYWFSAVIGNVAFIFLIFKTINSFFPEGQGLKPVVSFILGSLLLLLYHYVISRGIKNASVINALFTIAKIIPLLLVILFGLFVWKSSIFSVPDWKNLLAATKESTNLYSQINGAMGTILWCFIGIEAAVVMSTRATDQKTVGRATILGFFITLIIYMLISVVAMGVISADKLASAGTPLADVLAATALGSVGGTIVRFGVLVSVSGALLSWILLTAELPFIAAKDRVMPKWFEKENAAGVPINSLRLTNIVTFIFIFGLLSEKLQSAYNIAYTLATTVYLIPYLLSTIYAIKICINEKGKASETIIAVLATIYSVYVIYTVGLMYFGLAIIIYTIGLFVYYMAKKEKNEKFSKAETIAISVLVLVSAVMIALIASGKIAL
ncbi:arginine:ornithine antiporter, APA family [Caloramator quimbayensis]|uniref:Arginine:ornithine antiporter, APA family n=1 Tax=Caloramator quimbayensis TaxID=1147123 RepID=A0A1T4Y0X0_9CLOT|nr:basic amino acid/polyamine antiporter [Caloramator quimbayensis]SKA95420.1 arginine:ornithine antiporter, APA family [Caloramator quimbayensis]